MSVSHLTRTYDLTGSVDGTRAVGMKLGCGGARGHSVDHRTGCQCTGAAGSLWPKGMRP